MVWMRHVQLGDSGKIDIAVNCGRRRGQQCECECEYVWRGSTRTRAECEAEDVDDVSGVQTLKRQPCRPKQLKQYVW